MKDTNNNSSVYCPPNIKLVEVDAESIICQGNPYRWTTGTDPDDTKASTETVVRLRWDGGETVYAYEDSTCLGSLNASIESCLSLLLDNGKGNHFWRAMSVDEWESIGERNTADKKRKCGLVTVSISENKEVTGVIPANWMGVMVLWLGTIQRIWDCPYVW